MDEALLKRALPHSIEVGQSVIGSVLMDREAIISASEIVIADDFYQHQYGVMSESMVELFNGGKPVDLVTLQDHSEEKDMPLEVSSLEFIQDIITTVPASANMKSYADIVREKTVLRRLIEVNGEIADTCYVGRDKLEGILARTEKTILDLLRGRTSGELVPICRVAFDVLESIERTSKNKDTVTSVPSGFIDLDYKTPGFQSSDLILIAARPSMGKTAFVLNVVDNVTVRKEFSCMVFSLEVSRERPVNRMFPMESNVDSQKLRVEALTDSDWDAVVGGTGVIDNPKLIIDDTPGISITGLRSKYRKIRLKHGLSLVIIDYLQLMSGNGENGDDRQQETSEISRSLKALAREMQAPVIVLSQLSRTCEARQDHRPMFSDLQELGTIEQDIDVVMFLYRDDYYNKGTEDKDIVEAVITKQHDGPIGTVDPVWVSQYTKFADVVRQPYEQQINR